MKLTAESTVINDGKLNTNITNAQTTADNAQTTANQAKTVADNTAQYFWFTSSGTDTGAHISEQTQAQFVANPSGGNLLARSTGIAVRDGTTELATFTANGVDINKSGVSVASFGDTARVGKDASGHASVTSDGLHVWAGTEATSTNEVASFGSTARIGKTSDTNVAITPASSDSGIKMNVRNRAGTSSVRIADIGFDSTQGYEDDKNFPKGAWYTLGDRAGTTAQRGYYSLVSGFNNIASHNASVSFGINNKVYAPCGLAVGMENEVGNSAKTSQNSYTETYIGDCSTAIGYGLQTGNGRNQFVCGWYNQPTANASPLIVGIGTASSRRNGFVVSSNGDAVLYGTLTQGSDRRLKEHINYLDDEAIDFIDSLKPAHYTKDGEHHVGFYAQDVEKADKWGGMVGEMNGYKTLGYTELIAPLVAYVQKLEKRIEELERNIK